MKKYLSGAVATCLMLLASTAYAQSEEVEAEDTKPATKDFMDGVWFHADANIASVQFSSTEGNTTFVSDMFVASYFRAGVKYKYFGVEAELGTGVSGIDEGGVEIDLGTQKSVFGILRMPSEKFEGWVRAGYHDSDFDVTAGGQTGTAESSGFAAGLGGAYYLTPNVGIRADITAYNTRDIADAGFVGGSIGLTARF